MGLGHASVVGAVGPAGVVELPVRNGGGVVVAFDDVDTPVERGIELGREYDPVRSPALKLGVKRTLLEFTDPLGVSIAIVMFPVGVVGGKIVERLPVGNDGTVDQLIDTNDSLVMLLEGVGSGAVVFSNGRVVGGINVTMVTLPVGKESVMFVVAVTTKVEAVSAVRGGAVVFAGTELEGEKLPTRGASLVEMDAVVFTRGMVVVKPVESGTGRVNVVFALGVSMAMVMFDEGVAKPLALVELTTTALLEREYRPVRRSSVKLGVNVEAVPLADIGGMTPDAPVELVKPVADASVKLLPPENETPPVGTGVDRVMFAVSVTTSVLPGGMIPLSPVLFAVAVISTTVKLAVPAALVITSVITVGVMMPLLPVELKVAVEVEVAVEALPEIVVLEMITTMVSDETAVMTLGVSTPLSPVEVTVRTSLEAITRVLVLGPYEKSVSHSSVSELLSTAELADGDADGGGEMTPSPPVEKAVPFDPLMVNVTAPEDTIVSRMGVTEGVMIPLAPVEKKVAFAPESVNVVAVEETIVSTPAEPLTLAFKDTDVLGAMTPAVPVEKKVENTSMTVTLPCPPALVAGGVGVTMPSVPVEA